MMATRLARLRLERKRAYGHQGFNPAYMTASLQERMAELMAATGWTVTEIASISGVTSAAVSQWVGNGKGKQSKSIGDMEAAMRLEKSSGFRGLWLAKGKGPKLAEVSAESAAGDLGRDDLSHALQVLTKALQKADKNTRIALEPLLASMANAPDEASEKSQVILKLLVTKDTPASESQDTPRSSELGTFIGGSAFHDIGGKHNGRRDKDAAAGGKKG